MGYWFLPKTTVYNHHTIREPRVTKNAGYAVIFILGKKLRRKENNLIYIFVIFSKNTSITKGLQIRWNG